MSAERQLSFSPFVVAPLLIILAATASFIPERFRLVLGILYVLIFSWALGQRFFKKNVTPRIVRGLILLTSCIAILGSIFFYLYQTPPLFFFFISSILPLVLFISTKPLHVTVPKLKKEKTSIVTILQVGNLLTTAGILSILIKFQTYSSIVSPWIALPTVIFLLYATQLITLFALHVKKSATLIHHSMLCISSLSVATIVFPLGYGFDPFIHNASQELLRSTGTIEPKPPYYIGYYMITLWLHQLSGVTIITLNKIITLLFAALIVPSILKEGMDALDTKRALLAPLIFFLLPHPELIQSTPLSLAFVWLLILVFLLQKPSASKSETILIFSVAIATLFMHPLIGIPAILYVSYRHFPLNKFRALTKKLSIVAAIVAVPLALTIAASRTSELSSTITFNPKAMLDFIPKSFRFIVIDDLIYSFSGYIVLFVIVLSILGLMQIKSKTVRSSLYYSLAIALSAMVLVSFVSFNFGSDQEQGTFAARLFTVALYILLPLFMFGVMHLYKQASEKKGLLLVFMILLTLTSSASWYLSYPRFDTRDQNKGYTASSVDYKAVKLIAEIEHDNDYIVLANQTVSAVAVQELGFAQYHGGQLFYPLPTNSTLHKQFTSLLSLNSPVDTIIQDIQNAYGVDHIYVIVNDYWSDAQSISDRLNSYAITSTRVEDENSGLTILRY